MYLEKSTNVQFPVNRDFPLRLLLLSNCVTESSRSVRPSVIFDQLSCFRFSLDVMGGTPDRYVSASSKNEEQAFRSQKMSPLSESRM